MKNSTLTRILLNLFATILLTIVGIWGSYALDAILQNPFSENIEVRGFYVLVFIFVVFFTWLLYSGFARSSKDWGTARLFSVK